MKVRALLFGAILAANCASAQMVYFLVSQWTDSQGVRMCRYSNGAVIPAPTGLCAINYPY